MSDDLETFLEVARTMADKAGEAILPFFRTGTIAENKAPDQSFDPVTAADRAAEAAMRAVIEDTFPDHGIAGEEFEDKQAQSPFTWSLDPIDGTRMFLVGGVQWGTLIAQ